MKYLVDSVALINWQAPEMKPVDSPIVLATPEKEKSVEKAEEKKVEEAPNELTEAAKKAEDKPAPEIEEEKAE
jgi:hypothetical protein